MKNFFEFYYNQVDYCCGDKVNQDNKGYGF